MNTSKTEGVFDQAKGKIKQAVGEATNNQSLANSGAADQVKGHAKEAWGNVKDTAADLNERAAARTETRTDATRADAHAEGNHLRDKVANTAANVKDSINRGLDNLENKSRH